MPKTIHSGERKIVHNVLKYLSVRKAEGLATISLDNITDLVVNMTGKSTDRKSRVVRASTMELLDNLANFTLPESLSCSEVDYPIMVRRSVRVKWDDVLEEQNAWETEIEEYKLRKYPPPPKAPFLKTECDYIRDEVFVHLIPALEETLVKAKIWEALVRQKCFFNGIDHIVQELWNRNPRHPERKEDNLHLFNMPWVRKALKENPRPYYPKSWLWPEEYAATLIQKTVRQYFVQRDEEVQEMRDFWRKLEVEQGNPEIHTNPFLAKKFAATHSTKMTDN